jgi:hypothetical protein
MSVKIAIIGHSNREQIKQVIRMNCKDAEIIVLDSLADLDKESYQPLRWSELLDPTEEYTICPKSVERDEKIKERTYSKIPPKNLRK